MTLLTLAQLWFDLTLQLAWSQGGATGFKSILVMESQYSCMQADLEATIQMV